MNATVKESPEVRGPAAARAATVLLARRLAWDPAAMAAHRQAALRESLDFAVRHSPWHRDRLAGIDLGAIATDDLSRLPVMTPTELMANWDRIVTDPDLTLAAARAHLQALDEGGPFLLRDRYLVLSTGGSTGEPAVFCRQAQEMAVWLAGTGRWLSTGQASPTRFVSVGARSLRHGSAALPVYLYGQPPDRLLVPVDQPLASIFERLKELQPDVLHTYCSILGVLTQAAAAGSLRLSLTQLRAGADALPAGAADAAQTAFGVRPIQLYPTTDVGHIAVAEAGGNDDLYVNDDLLVLEAVDEADRPVAYGQCCHHLLVTSLYQTTLPIIRYRIDDRVILEPPSERHPAFSRISSIDGRSGDLFSYGGLIVHPHTFRAVIARHPQIRDYRIRQTADGAAISIVADAPVDVDVVTDQFVTALTKAGLTDPSIEVTRVDAIPRTTSGKQELFVRRTAPLSDPNLKEDPVPEQTTTSGRTGEGEYRRLPVDEGGDVGYYDSGRGEAILLVHAGVFSDWFRPLSLELPRDRLRVVRVRRSGYRDTTPPARHLSLADHARHAAVLLDELGIGAAHWVGHSSSCLIGLQLAHDRPGLVASLTLLEPAPGGDLNGASPADAQFAAATLRPAMEAFFAGDLGGAFDRFMRGIGGPGYPAVLTGQLEAAGLDTARAESAFFFADEVPAVQQWMFGPAQAARVTQPALVVLGGDSPHLTPLMADTVQRLSAMLPQARTQTLPGCSHLMPLQQPASLAQLITAFIKTIPAARAAEPVSP